jgi:hypothetical protein
MKKKQHRRPPLPPNKRHKDKRHQMKHSPEYKAFDFDKWLDENNTVHPDGILPEKPYWPVEIE